MSQTRGRVLFQVRGIDVGWLHGISRISSGGHNLGYICMFLVYNMSFEACNERIKNRTTSIILPCE